MLRILTRPQPVAMLLLILTGWDLYRRLDFKKIYRSMVKPAFLFDGRNIIDHNKCFTIGFNVYPMGNRL